MKRVLLVADGDPLRLHLYGQYFSDRGYVVETALSGLECLTQLQRWAPDVLLLDSELPWGGGAGVLARMREDYDLPSAPVIVLGTLGMAVADLVAAPVVACLPKPFRLESLLETVSDAASPTNDGQQVQSVSSATAVTAPCDGQPKPT